MKKTVILITSIICVFIFCSCDSTASEAPTSTAAGVIPTSLVFTTDGNGRYFEPALGEWNDFLTEVFKSYDSGEIDPESENIKYYGEGNDGHGYCFIVTTRNDSNGIISYNIDTAIISAEPNSSGDKVSGQDMVMWMYNNFHK